jgi:hypothetical protein
MQINQPYDTSFAYAFNWSQPEQDLEKALQILNAKFDAQHDSNGCPAASDEYWAVTILLVSNPYTPSQVLEHIAHCAQCPKVLERVAGHPNVNAETLKRLADCKHDDVRSAVAENLNVDETTLELLLKDDSTDVRFALAENPNIPMPILQELSNDDNPYVAHRAQVTVMKTGSTPALVKEMTPQPQQLRQRRAM